MKKLIALLMTAVLALSLAACGGAGKNNTSEPDAGNTDVEMPQNDEATEEATEAELQDDTAMVEELQERLTGDWGFPGNGTDDDIEHLTFNEDGTGSYASIASGKNYSFTYTIHIDHRTYNNGEAYVEYMLNMAYDNGETEDFIFFFNDNGQMAFHNSEDGGYFGVMDDIDVFTKE